jgi:flagellar basal-body rod modification protein FlgD
MTINPDIRTLHAASAGDAASSTNSAGAAAGTGAGENEFLSLLVTQLKNQDPLNPTDSSQFMSELAQFSQLQEVIGIHQDADALASAVRSAQDAAAAQSQAATGRV